MGMSGPAIYRYFGSRDELLAALITDGYRERSSCSVRPVASARSWCSSPWTPGSS
jgi:AcrR family transcriptional regulator